MRDERNSLESSRGSVCCPPAFYATKAGLCHRSNPHQEKGPFAVPGQAVRRRFAQQTRNTRMRGRTLYITNTVQSIVRQPGHMQLLCMSQIASVVRLMSPTPQPQHYCNIADACSYASSRRHPWIHWAAGRSHALVPQPLAPTTQAMRPHVGHSRSLKHSRSECLN